MPDLRVVQLTSAGVEDIVGHVPDGVTLCDAGGVHGSSVAELVLAMILASQRRLPHFLDAQRESRWDLVEAEDLRDKRVLVVGAGDLGQQTARRLRVLRRGPGARRALGTRGGPRDRRAARPAARCGHRRADPSADPADDGTRRRGVPLPDARRRACSSTSSRGPHRRHGGAPGARGRVRSAARRSGRRRPRAAAVRPPALVRAERHHHPARGRATSPRPVRAPSPSSRSSCSGSSTGSSSRTSSTAPTDSMRPRRARLACSCLGECREVRSESIEPCHGMRGDGG